MQKRVQPAAVWCARAKPANYHAHVVIVAGEKKWVLVGVGMGIQGLMKLIGDYAPSAIKENDIKTYFGEYFMERGNAHPIPFKRESWLYS